MMRAVANAYRGPRIIAADRQAPRIYPRMIPLCSRFDSVLFTPKMSAIASYGDYSRSPLVEQTAARRHLRTERRVALVRRQHHHHGAVLVALVEGDDVLVGHADVTRGNRLADIFRLVGAVDAVEGVLVTREQVH